MDIQFTVKMIAPNAIDEEGLRNEYDNDPLAYIRFLTQEEGLLGCVDDECIEIIEAHILDPAAASLAALQDEAPSDVDELLYRMAQRDCERLAAGSNDCSEDLPFVEWCLVCQLRGLIQKYRKINAAKPSGAREAAIEIAALTYNRHRDEKIAQYAEIISRHLPAVAAPVAQEWFDLALRYMRGDPVLTNVPYSEDSVFADFLRFWDGQTFHAQCVVKSVFQSAPKFNTPVVTEEPTK